MKKAPLAAALLFLLCALPLAAQSITVDHPGTGETCTKGQACAVAWTLTAAPGGAPPAGTAVIELMDKTQPTVRKTISPGVPLGNLQYSWTVPTDVAGQYRVRVRLQGAVLSDIGEVFTIKPQSGGSHPPGGVAAKAPMPAGLGAHVETAVIPIHIVSPGTGFKWEVAKSYFIRWTADTKPDDGFTVELCNTSGTKVWTIQEGEGAQRQADGTWFIPVNLPCGHPVCAGDYRVRITSLYLKKSALGGVFTIGKRTKKTVRNIEVQAQNAVLNWTNCGTFVTVNCESPTAGRSKVGFEYAEYNGCYGNNVLRSRLTFNLAEFKGKKGDVEKATLVFGDRNTCPGAAKAFCAAQIFALKAAEAANWNVPNWGQPHYLNPLTGWSSDAMTTSVMDITGPVREWIRGTQPNFGFVVTAVNEVNFGWYGGNHHLHCVSYGTPIMYVTFIEEECPCEGQ